MTLKSYSAMYLNQQLIMESKVVLKKKNGENSKSNLKSKTSV
jgi:hypothetical protein